MYVIYIYVIRCVWIFQLVRGLASSDHMSFPFSFSCATFSLNKPRLNAQVVDEGKLLQLTLAKSLGNGLPSLLWDKPLGKPSISMGHGFHGYVT